MSSSIADNDVKPVSQSVRVPAAPARAFRAFATAMHTWWDPKLSANKSKSPIAEIVLEPRIGGRWYERGADGSECEWARVLDWRAGAAITVDWHPDGHSTRLRFVFESPAPRATTILLQHDGFETYGDRAAQMRDMHDAIWGQLLGRFVAYMQEQHAEADESSSDAQNRSARAVTDGDTILATIDIDRTPDRIFRALTTSETEQWWGAPDTYRVRDWRSVPRIGGEWSLVVVTPDGGAFPAGGAYLDIDAPHRLVQTRHYDFDYPELGRRDTTVTYRIDPISTGSRVTVRHDGFAGLRVAADHHAEGWVGFLEYLAAYLKSEGGASA